MTSFRLATIGALIAAVAACDSGSSSPPPERPVGIKGNKRPGEPVKTDIFNDRAKAVPKRGGEITQAAHVGFRSLDAEQDNSSLTSEVVHTYIQEALVDGDAETWDDISKLAERWDVEDNLELKDGKVVRGKVTEGGQGYDADTYVVRSLKGDTIGTYKKADVKELRAGTSFTFYLRKGVEFHNGHPFTAKDVEWSIKLFKHPKNGMPNLQGYFDKITEVAVIDDFTVRITYVEQYWMALTVCGGYAYMRPHKAWDPDGLLDKDPDAFFKTFNQHPLMMNPIGTGPYMLDSYKKDFEVVLKRYDKWWGAKGRPAPDNGQWPDKIRFRIIKDVVAQLAALKNGEVDYVYTIPPEQFDDFFSKEENRKNFAAVEIVDPSEGYVGFNLRRDMWKDKRVRWALAYAHCDLEKFIKEVMRGRAERVTSDYYMYSPSYDASLKKIPFDLKKAEDQLADAGWFDSDGDGVLDKDGKKFEFEMLVREMPPTMPVIQHLLQMQANLKNLKIKMEIRKLEWTAFLDKIDKGDFDVCRLGWRMASPPDKQDLYQIWHSSQIGESGSNHVSYANKEVDDLLTRARRELDGKKRWEMEHRIQTILYEDQPYIWLYMPAELRAYNKKWRGVRFWVPKPCTSLNEWYLGE